MKLQPYHFVTPSKPDNEDEIEDWNVKFGSKPEPKWKFFKDEYPKIGQIIVWGWGDNEAAYPYKCPFSKGDEDEIEPDDQWYDFKEFNDRFKIWQDHQVKYPGFEKNIRNVFRKKIPKMGILCVSLPEEKMRGYISYIPFLKEYQLKGSSYYSMNISIEMFEFFCKENNIEL